MNKEKEKIINEIDKNQDKILSNLKQKHIDTYCWIKKGFDQDRNVAKDLEFQRTFKAFYIMNAAGLSDKQKERFFELLSNKESNLEYILSELYKIPRRDGRSSIQFSFTTKLIHTIDDTKPIYDRNVANIINKNVLGVSEKEKINSCIEIFDYLNELYLSLIKENEIKKIISRFRRKFNVNDIKISDIKILDFIMWSFGNLKNNKEEQVQKKDIKKIFNRLEEKILLINKSIKRDDNIKSYNKYEVNGYGFVNIYIRKEKLKIEVKKQELKEDIEGIFKEYPNGLYSLWKWIDIRQEEELDYVLKVIKEVYNYTVGFIKGKKLKETRVEEVVKTKPKESIEDKIRRIIKGGERHKVEFKSSCLNKFEIAKNISAFMNTNGGMLLIGVNDGGNIIGLDRDYENLRNRPYGANDRDRFLLKLDYIIRNFLGVEFIFYIKIKILEIDNKDICIISLDVSNSPSFIRGDYRPLLYTRLEVSTVLANKSEEIRHIKERFYKKEEEHELKKRIKKINTRRNNLPFLELKRNLADKYIKDSKQKEIFLREATQFKQWANYIAGLVLTQEGKKIFTSTDIKKILKERLIPDYYNKPGFKESSLLIQDVEVDSKKEYHLGYPFLERVNRGEYKFIGFNNR